MTGEKFKVKIRMSLVILLALAAGLLSQGCGKTQSLSSSSGYPMTVSDQQGRQVTISREPQRIVSLAPATTEILFALGLGDKVAAVTKYCDYPLEAREKPKIGGFSTPSAELIVAAEPDLILASSKRHKDFIPQLENAGLTVVATESLNLGQVLEEIRFIGQVTGASEASDQLTANLQQRIDSIEDKVKGLPDTQKPSVYFEIFSEPLTTAGSKSFIDSLITTAGGKNIAADINQDWVVLSPEVVLARDPEIIIFISHGSSMQTAEQLKGRKGWEQVSAVRNNLIGYIEDENLVVHTGPRVVEGLEQIARIIHPGLF